MHLTLEKVAILKSVEIFADTPDFVLASVAAITDELEISAGTTFMRAGDVEDCMYIIVAGRVQVGAGAEARILEPGYSLGELEALSPGERSASAQAVDDATLFRINRDAFDELMADRPEIARSVIRMLCNRLRARAS